MATVEEFTALVTTERDTLVGWFWRRLQDQDRNLAEDLAQITLLDLWRHLDTIKTMCKTLIYKTAKRRLQDHERTRERRPKMVSESEIFVIVEPRPGPERLVEMRDTIHREMAKRSEDTRKLLWWRAIGYTEREIAEALRLKIGTIKSRGNRARSLTQPTRKLHGQEIRRAAMDLAKSQGRITSASVAEATGLHPNVIGNHLRNLEKDGLLITCGVEVRKSSPPRLLYGPTERLLAIETA